ncbi:MAG: response regulator transcription factor [Acidobacteriaceae bacterium]
MIADRARILVVDDEPQIVRVLRTTLVSRGYEMRTATTGVEGLEMFEQWRPNLIITDLAMPEMDGIELCRQVRQSSETPIIVLSVRGQEESKVRALDAGADDYVTKPFSIQELEARIRAQLRRSRRSELSIPTEAFSLGEFVFDVPRHNITLRNVEVRLTPKQFDLLLYFAQHAGQVLTHRALLKAVWGAQAMEQPEYLRVAVGQLRKKLGEGETPRYIRTEPWVGYRFCPDGCEC